MNASEATKRKKGNAAIARNKDSNSYVEVFLDLDLSKTAI